MTEPIKILLVEDNETHAHFVMRHLGKDVEADVTQAASLAEAMCLLEQDLYSAVLLDLSLPDSPIAQTLQRILDRHPDLPVVVLTSLDDLEFATSAVHQGAQDYLLKSGITSDLLLRSLRYAIERKRVQRQIETYAQKLEESNKHLMNFAHTLAHEVRSPLTVVSGFLQLIELSHGAAFDAASQQCLQDSKTAIVGMTQLVESLLEFAQVNATDQQRSDVDLETVFYHVYAVLRPMLLESGGEITHDPLPRIQANEVQLRQLLQNLMTNSIKFRREERLKIHVGCDSHEGSWIISVADNGRGIEQAEQKRIFDAFTRLESTSHISGAGIGLAFCKKIVENHGGRIWVESQLGIGSTFRFSIPHSH